MKTFNRFGLGVLVVVFVIALSGSLTALAATTPSLGSAASFGILSSTYTNTVAGSTINGNLGYTTGPAVAPVVSGLIHAADSVYNQAGIDQNSALNNLNSQACTFTFAGGAIDLATDTTHGPIGVYTPGVYCTSGAASIGTAGITLSGGGTYIFRIGGALTTVANSVVTLAGGVSSCDVFWTPTAATTLGANSTFRGTLIDTSGITVGSTVDARRLLAFGGTVSTTSDTLTVPTCAVATTTPTPSATPTPSLTPTPSPTLTPTPSTTPSPTPVPALPNTGVGPDGNSGTPWNTILPIGILVALSALYLARKKLAV